MADYDPALVTAVQQYWDNGRRAHQPPWAQLPPADQEGYIIEWCKHNNPPCSHRNTWFSRTLCAEPCDTMHTYCSDCNVCLDHCAHDVESPNPDLMAMQSFDAHERAELAEKDAEIERLQVALDAFDTHVTQLEVALTLIANEGCESMRMMGGGTCADRGFEKLCAACIATKALA